MARRRKKDSDILAIAQGIAALIVLAMLHPGTRAVVQQLGEAVPWIILFTTIFFILVAFAFLLKAKASQKSASQENTETAILSAESHRPAPVVSDDSRYMPKPKKTLGEQIHAIDWFQFEKLIEVAYAPTHKVTRRGGAKADGGIDLIIEDATGPTAVQCKHWKAWKVGVRNVRELIGAMADAGIKKGILITIKGYSCDAAELAQRHAIQLLDELAVVELIKNADAARVQAILEDQRKFCPRCENEMVLRTVRKGTHNGNRFWGCSEYPKCSYTLPFEVLN